MQYPAEQYVSTMWGDINTTESSAIIRGTSNVAIPGGIRNSIIVGGRNGSVLNDAEITYSNGVHGIGGIAKMSDFILNAYSTTAVAPHWVTMYLDYPTNTKEIVLPANSTGSIWIRAVAGRITVDHCSCARAEYTYTTINQTLTAPVLVHVACGTTGSAQLVAATPFSLTLVANVLTVLLQSNSATGGVRYTAHLHILSLAHDEP